MDDEQGVFTFRRDLTAPAAAHDSITALEQNMSVFVKANTKEKFDEAKEKFRSLQLAHQYNIPDNEFWPAETDRDEETLRKYATVSLDEAFAAASALASIYGKDDEVSQFTAEFELNKARAAAATLELIASQQPPKSALEQNGSSFSDKGAAEALTSIRASRDAMASYMQAPNMASSVEALHLAEIMPKLDMSVNEAVERQVQRWQASLVGYASELKELTPHDWRSGVLVAPISKDKVANLAEDKNIDKLSHVITKAQAFLKKADTTCMQSSIDFSRAQPERLDLDKNITESKAFIGSIQVTHLVYVQIPAVSRDERPQIVKEAVKLIQHAKLWNELPAAAKRLLSNT